MEKKTFTTAKQINKAFGNIPTCDEWEFLILHQEYVEQITLDNDNTSIRWTLGDEEDDDKYTITQEYIGSSEGAFLLLATLGFNVEFC